MFQYINPLHFALGFGVLLCFPWIIIFLIKVFNLISNFIFGADFFPPFDGGSDEDSKE